MKKFSPWEGGQAGDTVSHFTDGNTEPGWGQPGAGLVVLVELEQEGRKEASPTAHRCPSKHFAN